MDATPEKLEHGRSDNLPCTHCNKIMPYYALFCGACGESLGTNISELPQTSNTPGVSDNKHWGSLAGIPEVTSEVGAHSIDDQEEATIPRLACVRPSGIQPRSPDSHVFIRLPWLWQAIIILSAVAAALFTFMFPPTPLRPVVVMWFLFICPGMMLVRFLRLNELVVEWVLALALSLALDAIVSGIVLYAGKWSPVAILGIIIGLSLAGAITQLTMLNQASV
ncbi:MAG TPA: hypothetical protein VF844_00075 [Ktedonobacteraceae bacterium]